MMGRSRRVACMEMITNAAYYPCSPDVMHDMVQAGGDSWPVALENYVSL